LISLPLRSQFPQAPIAYLPWLAMHINLLWFQPFLWALLFQVVCFHRLDSSLGLLRAFLLVVELLSCSSRVAASTLALYLLMPAGQVVFSITEGLPGTLKKKIHGGSPICEGRGRRRVFGDYKNTSQNTVVFF
jgi:hypothetical protein